MTAHPCALGSFEGMGLHPLGRFRIALGEVQTVGSVAQGQRRVSLITGGQVEGPFFTGEVLPGGSDWQLIRGDGVVEIDARFVVQLQEGGLLSVRNQGYRHGPPEVMAALARGEQVPAHTYYFCSVLWFEAPEGRLSWLGKTLVLATGTREGGEVRFEAAAMAGLGGTSTGGPPEHIE
ncbi:DUF3237 domain-containing protein [Archangium violaceum]|uniref:DUF3237 domain-containing protein n=1 Tax=Archangium violaceum TaxID=83451 RepID=UPI002B2E4607|nr:DUF3237 domain-containing protein [Archangium violaceum]